MLKLCPAMILDFRSTQKHTFGKEELF